MPRVKVARHPESGYVVSSDSGPRFLLVSLAWLDALVQELYDQRMLAVNGEVKPPERAR